MSSKHERARRIREEMKERNRTNPVPPYVPREPRHWKTFRSWHQDEKLWREIYARVVSALIAGWVAALVFLLLRITKRWANTHQDIHSDWGILLILASLGFFGGASYESIPKREDGEWKHPNYVAASAWAAGGLVLIGAGVWLLNR